MLFQGIIKGMEFITDSAKQTQKLAAKIIEEAAAKKTGGALVLALQGELGAGKITFVQGLAKALGVKERILSPTFVIMKHFNILTFKRFSNFYHIDCYRIENPRELMELRFTKIVADPKNIVTIEWAEKIKKSLPEKTIWLKFEHRGEDERSIKISNG